MNILSDRRCHRSARNRLPPKRICNSVIKPCGCPACEQHGDQKREVSKQKYHPFEYVKQNDILCRFRFVHRQNTRNDGKGKAFCFDSRKQGKEICNTTVPRNPTFVMRRCRISNHLKIKMPKELEPCENGYCREKACIFLQKNHVFRHSKMHIDRI